MTECDVCAVRAESKDTSGMRVLAQSAYGLDSINPSEGTSYQCEECGTRWEYGTLRDPVAPGVVLERRRRDYHHSN
jgi:hypothetical protein